MRAGTATASPPTRPTCSNATGRNNTSPPDRLKRWARQLGPDVHTWVSRQLERRPHPEQAYRTCLGLLQLSKRYPASRLNAACQTANQTGLVRLKQVKHLLESNQDNTPDTTEPTTPLPQDHENVRGPQQFH